MPKTPDNADRQGLRALALVGQLGLVVAACIVSGVGAGVVLDRWLGGRGLVLVAMVLLGVAAGAYAAYRLLAKEIPWNP
ncbi:MAG: AtpZ/AtpI family protein [Candidatus Hydrogenedentes bacterium]|nr:AtpZ/AtpI family protein [Candidatus Hydrogenedentota bacterium]